MNVYPDESAFDTFYLIDFKTDLKLHAPYFEILKTQSHKQKISVNTKDSNLQYTYLTHKADNFVLIME